MHVHVNSGHGEAKFWIEPTIALARSHGLSERELMVIQRIIEERKYDIVDHCQRHFGG